LCQVAALHRDRVSRCVRLSNNHNHDRSVIALDFVRSYLLTLKRTTSPRGRVSMRCIIES
jgi:hypothetical protein